MKQKICPRCHTTSFDQKAYEGVEIDQCRTCQGIWLDEGELITIIEEREKTFSREFCNEVIKRQRAGIPQDEIKTQVACAVCGKAMRPNNYNYNSGVIIDFCPSNHGVWLDHLELEKIQAHKEEWENRKSSLGGKKLQEAMEKVNALNDEYVQSCAESSILSKVENYLKSRM